MRKREKRDRERLMSAANCLNGFFFHALSGAAAFLWVPFMSAPFYTLDSASVFWLNVVIGEEIPPIIVLRDGGIV